MKISQYGPIGFYDYKTNCITISRHSHICPVKIIKHEMIHIIVEPYVLKYKFDHTQKEYIVETLGTMFDLIEEKRTGIQTG